MKFFYCSFFAVGLLLLAAACTADELPMPEPRDCGGVDNPTYEVDIEPIMARSCAYSGCHLDVGPGLYNTYEGYVA